MKGFKNYVFIIVSVLLIISSCAMAGDESTTQEDCVPNFTVDGNFFTGKTYKSSREFPEANKSQAFDNVVAELASDGWQIINSNKEIGLISASQTVILGEGKTAPLNVVIREAQKGIKVSIAFALSGGLVTSANAVVEDFCKIYKSI